MIIWIPLPKNGAAVVWMMLIGISCSVGFLWLLLKFFCYIYGVPSE